MNIAVLTAAEYEWSHGTSFSQIINGCSAEQATSAGAKHIPSTAAGPVCDDARVTAVWTPDIARTKIVAQALDIPWIMRRPEEAVGKVDAVITTDDGCETRADRNAAWAMPYIEAGTPVFLDKPLSHSAEEAVHVVDTARSRKTPILCCSGLRYTKALQAQQDRMAALGDVLAADGAGPLGWLVFYGVHVIDPLISLVGGGARWVEHRGTSDQHLVIVGYEGGRTITFRSLPMAYGFHFSLYGRQGVDRFSILPEDPDFAEEHFHVRTVEAALDMFRTGRMPISYEEQLESAKILIYARASLQHEGRRYMLDDPINC